MKAWILAGLMGGLGLAVYDVMPGWDRRAGAWETEYATGPLRLAAYDDGELALRVVFRTGAECVYTEVEPEVYVALRSAAAPAEYFNRYIRGRYPRRGAGAAGRGAE